MSAPPAESRPREGSLESRALAALLRELWADFARRHKLKVTDAQLDATAQRDAELLIARGVSVRVGGGSQEGAVDAMLQVTLGDKTLWLLGRDEGPLCERPGDYEQGICSYAHLMEDGRVMRFHQQIGTRDDLTFTGVTYDATPTLDGFTNIFTHPSWDASIPGDEIAPLAAERAARALPRAERGHTDPTHEMGCSSGVGMRCTCRAIRLARAELELQDCAPEGADPSTGESLNA